MTDTAAKPITPRGNRWVALAILLIASFMNLIDVTIVNVALPSMQEGFDATSAAIQWVVAGYIFAFALGLLPFGRLGDRFGRRKFFVFGIAGFTFASALCGVAPNMEVLIGARLLQGLFAAMMMPQVMALMQVMYAPHERGMAFGMFGTVVGLAAVTGPVIGGILVSADLFDLSWRPVFLINIPIGITGAILGWKILASTGGNPAMKVDLIGIALSMLALFLIIFPLIEGREMDWPLWSFVMLGLSPFGFAALLYWTHLRHKAGRSQLLPHILISSRGFQVGTILSLVFFSVIPGFFMIMALFLQSGFGLSPLASGLTNIPFPIGLMIASTLQGQLGDRWLRQRLIVGIGVMFVGVTYLQMSIAGIGDTIPEHAILLPLLIMGLGSGTSIGVMFQTILTTVPAEDAGAASGTLQAMQQVGGALGVAMLGQIFFSILGEAGPGEHAIYVEAASASITYQLVALVVVALLVFALPRARSNEAAKGSSARAAAG